MTLIAFEAAKDIGYRLLDLLHRHGINPTVGSEIEDELLSVVQLIEVMKNPDLARGPNRVSILRSAAGLHDLAAKVLSVEPLPDFSGFIDHLRLISESKGYPATLGQIAKSGPYDDTARKMAELYIGCLAAHVGTNVILDHPTRAKGDNPDVIFTVEETSTVRGLKRWTLAIKTISSQQGQTIFDRISDGAKQINDPKCSADYGMVVINAKNALDHDVLWSPPIPFSDLQTANDALLAQLQKLADNAAYNRCKLEWDALFTGKVVRPVIFMGQSLVSLPTAVHTRTPTTLKMLLAYGADGPLDPVGACLAERLNHYMQSVLLGIPGSPGKEPS